MFPTVRRNVQNVRLHLPCLAHRHDKEDMIPVKTPKKARTQDNRTVFIIQDGECTAIRKRPEKGLLAGLYELPNIQGHFKKRKMRFCT